MATLTAWKFEDATGAATALDILDELQRQELIHVLDGAWVTWPADRSKPATHQLGHSGAAGAIGGTFWGLLFGLIFFVPFLGMAVGAAVGALAGSLREVGIDEHFIEGVREQVTPGTSALFLLTEAAVIDKVQEAFAGLRPELVSSNLSSEQEAKLREAFGED